MRKRLFLFFIPLIFLSLYGCERENKPGAHKYITFVNNSDNDVYVSHSAWSPDTLCYDIMQTHNNPQYYKVNAHSASDRALGLGRYRKDTWENFLSNNSIGTVIVFVHDATICDSVCTDKNINWNYMNDREKESLFLYLNEQIIIKRYYYTLNDLERLDWTIIYP